MKNLTPKKVNSIFLIVVLVGGLISMIAAYMGNEVIPFIGIVIMMLALVFRFATYRCPHCGSYLDRSTGEFCPYCGKKVEDSETIN